MREAENTGNRKGRQHGCPKFQYLSLIVILQDRMWNQMLRSSLAQGDNVADVDNKKLINITPEIIPSILLSLSMLEINKCCWMMSQREGNCFLFCILF